MRETQIVAMNRTMNTLPAVTPGELLRKEFLEAMGISRYSLARKAGISAQAIQSIILGNSSISADIDTKLCNFFGLSEGYWLRAQITYDREIADKDLRA
mgnify:CR=1 FL=1